MAVTRKGVWSGPRSLWFFAFRGSIDGAADASDDDVVADREPAPVDDQ
jgi:hypothetical protein